MLASDPELPLAPGTMLGDQFTVERLLARGGMGAVYAARGPDGAQVAVKVLLPSLAGAPESSAHMRFLREAQLSSSLSSPHIVKVLAGGIDAATSRLYMAMEMLSGEDLEGLIERTGPLHVQTAVRIIMQAARGLDVAHAAGIVHRDIKPSNLFLDNRGGAITVKVCDFGVAKLHPALDAQHLTSTGSVLGTPLYMSPEQVLSSKNVDLRTDVFSLAMTLYHALAGKPALAHVTTFHELVTALTLKPIPPLTAVAPWVPAGLAALVHGALVRDLELRCPDVVAFADAIARFAGGGPELIAGMLVAQPSEQRAPTGEAFDPPASFREALSLARGPDPMLGKMLGGRYRLLRTLGEGGMGAVYEAESDSHEHIAVKVLRPELAQASGDGLRRLLREARVAMAIQSPHVVRTSEIDTDMQLGVPFICMELLRGEDLARVVEKKGAIEPSAACRLIHDAALGLAAAHALGVVHRDIKPANLFLHQGDGDALTVKVCDFGIAKQLREGGLQTSTDLTHTGGLLGSPLYMSPEQARNAKSVDLRTDLFSLSLSLYEALTGHRAWEGFTSPGELVLAICTQDVKPVQDLAPWVPPGLAEVVHKGLSRDPAQRWPSAQAMAEALAPFAAPCPSLTRTSLVPVDEAQRSSVAARWSLSPSSRRESDQSSTSDVVPRGPASKRAPSTFAYGALAALAFAGAAAAAFTLTRDKTPPTVGAASADARPATSAPAVTVTPVAAPLSAWLQVRAPDQARLTVNGRDARVDEGKVKLEGEAGDSFMVAVEHEGQRKEASVTLRKDGTLIPDSIELQARTRDQKPRDPAKKPAPDGKAEARPEAKPAARPDPKPDSAPRPEAVKQQTDWR